ncbi:hypothetical protein GCM10027082_34970 [Comamonas humi]
MGIRETHLAGLTAGQLQYQSCRCGHRWLPAREHCPVCLSDGWTWRTACGEGVIKSWVVYHVAYHPDFKDRLPYNVAIIQLDEGPRLISNIDAESGELRVGAKVRYQPQGREIHRFAII